MKVIWVCNTLDEKIARAMDVELKKPESWISSLLVLLEKEMDIQLIYLFPNKKSIKKIIDDVTYISYLEHQDYKYDCNQEIEFEKIIKEESPDLIHIFGTESPHSLAILKCVQRMGLSNKTIIQLQGIVKYCAEHYYAYLPFRVIYGFTIRNILLQDSVFQMKRRYEKRGVYEERTLQLAKNIVGRSEWDKACVSLVNKEAKYYLCNEPLRDSFYNNKWNIDLCEKYSVFVSQGNYPLKGFHLMLEALSTIKKHFPEVHLYTTGKDPRRSNFSGYIKRSKYQQYLASLIKKYDLSENVTFLGYLNEQEMCKQFLKSNVFVLCSAIENSSNSLGEAMLLGVPSVAADVGGVGTFLKHKIDGFLYPADESYMLAYYVMKLFDDVELQTEYSNNARIHATTTHNKDNIIKTLKEIYKTCYESV